MFSPLAHSFKLLIISNLRLILRRLGLPNLFKRVICGKSIPKKIKWTHNEEKIISVGIGNSLKQKKLFRLFDKTAF